MKTFQSLCVGVIAAAGLALAPAAIARDSHHGGHHGGHHSGHHGGHHSSHHGGHHYSHHSGHHGHYSDYGHGYYGGHHSLLSFGLYNRPYYYSSYSHAPRVYAYRGYRVAPADDLAASVQVALARRGYYRGPIDGILGSGSRRALRAFQSDEGLAVTGRVTASTLDALGIG